MTILNQINRSDQWLDFGKDAIEYWVFSECMLYIIKDSISTLLKVTWMCKSFSPCEEKQLNIIFVALKRPPGLNGEEWYPVTKSDQIILKYIKG